MSLSPRARYLLALVLSAPLALDCRQAEVPPYVRVSGPAPALPGPPSTDSSTLVVFWAAWCAPCRAEAPSLLALTRNPVPGLSIRLVSHDSSLDDVMRFFEGSPPPSWRVTLDPGGALLASYGGDTLPVAFLASGGQLLARFKGTRDWNSRATRQLLARLIAAVDHAPKQTADP